jgi:hypothetical protein
VTPAVFATSCSVITISTLLPRTAWASVASACHQALDQTLSIITPRAAAHDRRNGQYTNLGKGSESRCASAWYGPKPALDLRWLALRFNTPARESGSTLGGIEQSLQTVADVCHLDVAEQGML